MHRFVTFHLLFILLALCPAAAGQALFPAPDSSAAGEKEAIFRAIEKGLLGGDIRLFSAYFSRTVSLNVRGSEPGYYSANQAGQVIRHFLSNRNFPSFRFTTVDTGSHPFATGAATLTVNGQSERVQVYASLSRDRSGWIISQFNIY